MNKPDLLLLHGALGASDQFDKLVPLLEDAFHVHRLDFEGHGRAPLRGRTFHNDHFVENVGDYLSENDLAGVDIFGYSLGGYVALTLAGQRPELVGRVASLATKFLWDADIVKREVGYLDVETIKAKVPHFAEMLAQRHTAAGWETVVNNTRDLLWSNTETGGLTAAFMATLDLPVRIIVGDRDHTVSIEEATAIFRALKQGELEVYPRTPHPFEKVSVERLARSLKEFFI